MARTNKAPAGPNKKRILVVSQHFWPEAFRITDIVEGFLEDSIEVDVLCGLPNYPKGEWFDGFRYTGPRRQHYKGADVFRAGEVRRKNNTSLRIFLNYVSFPFNALFSLPRLHGRRYDAVFCYCTSPVMMMFPAIVWAKLHRTPLVTYVLDLWPDNLYSVLPLQNKALRSVAQGVSNWHYRRSDKLIAMSDKLADRLREVTSKRKKQPQIAVIPQYCEDFYARDVASPSIKEKYKDTFTLLFAGNISPAQDLENLVNAVELIEEKTRAKSLTCLILGDGMSKDTLKETIRAKGLEHRFEFCGSVQPEEIPTWTGAVDALFAALSKSANLGLTVPAKITSYFAAGRPMLVAADGEAARVSAESGAALVSPAGDAKALAANLLALLEMDAASRAAMGEKGRAVWKEEYSRAKGLARLENFILGDKPTRHNHTRGTAE